MKPSELLRRARLAFGSASPPPMTLRAGNAADDYRPQPPFDAALDVPTDAYLEELHYGVPYLDPASWRHYVPVFLDYALRHLDAGSSLVVFAFLYSFSPPERHLSSLDDDQKAVLRELLEVLAFDPRSAFQEEACGLLEQWAP